MGRTARKTRSPYAAANRKSAHHSSDGETVIYRRTGSVNATTQRVPQQQPTASLSPELEQVADTVTQRIVPELKDQIAKAIEAIQRTPTLCSTPDTDLSAAHPSSTPGLLKYIYNVKLGADRCADMGWLTYDQQFRLKRARNPSMNWGCVDMELWLLYISQGVTPTQEPQISQMNAGKCFLYNNKGRCGRSACRYLHRCLKCGGAHAALFCNLKTTRSDFRREKAIKTMSMDSDLSPHRQSQEVYSQYRLTELGKTPIKVERLRHFLKSFPNKIDAHILLDGFTNGFKVNYMGPRQAVNCSNLISAKQHESELEEKITKEIQAGRIAGPFKNKPFSNLRLSPIGLVAKSLLLALKFTDGV
ncbi:unnamed protein product [Mytilus edulis]|uniref:C3H1-type domain-containing protein n=1 Tax=Mytilus edulis TaxID=6550 RepID=A0A8S3SGL1_MYTED|nr:unnamed protein product [Mytilus edulis]